MRILTTLTYYAPHISGLTVYARRLIRELVARGHDVTVLTSHYEPALPRREEIDGARVVRSPVLVRVSKGTLMPLLPLQGMRLVASHDLVHVHLPQFEGSQAALTARMLGKPVVVTYHCDIQMPRGLTRLAFTPAIRASHYLAGKAASRIVVNSEDYAGSARLPQRFRQKVQAIYPPVELAPLDGAARRSVAARLAGTGPLIGFVGRFAEEKGIEHLIEALPRVRERFPGARLAFVGAWEAVPGEHVYERLQPRLAALGDAAVQLGVLSDGELAAFYEAIDVLALPSINSTESFGMTQAEAMLAGTPVVATSLPGVREAVMRTGMGALVAPRDAQSLAHGICDVLAQRERYTGGAGRASALFGTAGTADAYEAVFASLIEPRTLPDAEPVPAAGAGRGDGP